MLNLEEIAQRIDNPQLCRVEDLDDLKAMAEKYPYAQIFPILYLKGLSIHNHVSFEEELTNFSYRISDRKQLYQLIHQHETVELTDLKTIPSQLPDSATKHEENSISSIKIEATTHPEEITEPVNNVPQEIISLPTHQEIVVNDDDNDDEVEEVFIPLNISTIESNVIHENTPSDSKIDAIIPKESDLDDSFTRELLSSVISANYTIDSLGTEEVSTDVIEEVIVKQDLNESQQLPEKRSFTDWLKANENDTTLRFDEEKRKIESIVNQFIENEPKISRNSPHKTQEEKPKKEFFSPTKKAKESLELTHMPVSETLAKIFALQGNYPKAIYVFEQLILKNPEKKVFFVAQIEELRKKLNTQ